MTPMTTDDVQYLDWQWVEENPESALDLMLKLHRENAALRDVINDIRSEINRNVCASNLVKVDRVYCILRDLERKEAKP